MLDKEQFLNIVTYAPLVSIDLIVRSEDNGLLMGLRTNQPAAGYWFVPGGSIKKNETLETAFLRITETELGTPIKMDKARLIGAFTHIYNTNFADEPGIGTHYVAIAYELRIMLDLKQLPMVQHSQYRWIHKNDKISSIHKNSMAYFSQLTKDSNQIKDI